MPLRSAAPGRRPRALGVPRAQPIAHLHRGPHRARRVVRGADGRAEHRLDLIADELEHEAAVGADRLVHLGEVRIEVAHDLAGLGDLHPRREVAQVREEQGGLDQLALAADAAGQDLVADLGRHVLAERLRDPLPLAQAMHHAVEALGHRPDLVGADHGRASSRRPRSTSAIAASTSLSGAATLLAASTDSPTAAATPTPSRNRMVSRSRPRWRRRSPDRRRPEPPRACRRTCRVPRAGPPR